MTPVTDPAILAQLNAPQPSAGAGPTPVTDPNILAQLNKPRDFGIDWSRPVADVRADLASLPEADRPEALQQWAEAYVAAERRPAQRPATPESYEGGDPRTLNDMVRLFARGTIAGPWLDEANALTAAGLHSITGGRAGAPYDEAVAYQRAVDRATDREYGNVGAATQVAGALAGGGAAHNAARRLGLPALTASTVPRQAAVLAPVGAAQAASYAAGVSEGTPTERLQAGVEAAPVGAVVGAAAPVVLRAAGAVARPVYDYVSPTVARWGANVREIPRRIGIHASADGGVPMSAGDRAAAEQVIANQAVRSGVTGEQLSEALAAGGEHGRFWSNSRAQDARVLADLDPALQRLASSASRASPEAGNIAADVMRARQTGLASDIPRARSIVEAAGIPTRPEMALRRATDKPAGQFERIRDAFRRSMLIKDEDYHGHLGTGRRTEEAIVSQARREADELYANAYRAGESVDVPMALAPVLRKWQAELANQAEPVQTMLGRLMASFARSRNLQQFDRNKRYLLDARIDNLRKSAIGRNPETARVLTLFKQDLMEAMDNATGGEQSLYRQARNAFESQMTLRDALRAGRDAFREQSEVGVDAFRALLTDGEKKLFRLGLLDSYTDRAAAMRSGADRLQLFDNPRIREILSEVLPRRGSFDNPVRLGEWLQSEGRMIQTRNEVVGNSKTAQRLADDEAYRALNTITEVFQSTGSPTQAVLKAAERAVQMIFGMRQDTSAAIARMLFTADPAQRRMNLQAIIRRMGANRAEMLARYLGQYQAALAGIAARGVTAAGAR